jgi:hypothetical protein
LKAEGYKLLTRVQRTTFKDSIPFEQEEEVKLVKYIGVYVMKDSEVGIPSDEVSIVVRKGLSEKK